VKLKLRANIQPT